LPTTFPTRLVLQAVIPKKPSLPVLSPSDSAGPVDVPKPKARGSNRQDGAFPWFKPPGFSVPITPATGTPPPPRWASLPPHISFFFGSRPFAHIGAGPRHPPKAASLEVKVVSQGHFSPPPQYGCFAPTTSQAGQEAFLRCLDLVIPFFFHPPHPVRAKIPPARTRPYPPPPQPFAFFFLKVSANADPGVIDPRQLLNRSRPATPLHHPTFLCIHFRLRKICVLVKEQCPFRPPLLFSFLPRPF